MEEQKFEWLTEEICKEYMARAAKLAPNGGQDTGAWRALREELQTRCNITEVQAYNILRGQNIKDYVQIYGIKSGRIPETEAMKAKREKTEKKSMAEKLKAYEDKIEELESLNKTRFTGGSSFGFEERD